MPIKPEKVLPKVENMICRLAWNATRPDFPFEDARQEAFLGFLKACEKYDSKRGMKFSSWCYLKVKDHLTHCRVKDARKQSHISYFEPDLIVRAIEGHQQINLIPPSRWRDMLEELSRDALEVVSLIVDTPGDLLGDGCTPRELLKRVLEHVQYERGLDKVSAEIILTEIKFGLEDALA